MNAVRIMQFWLWKDRCRFRRDFHKNWIDDLMINGDRGYDSPFITMCYNWKQCNRIIQLFNYKKIQQEHIEYKCKTINRINRYEWIKYIVHS